jgi:hypothetical protein
MGRASPRMGGASLGVSIAPSRVRRVARGAAKDARGTSKAPRRVRTGALDLRRASVVNGSGARPHASGIPTKTSGCSPRSDGSCRGSSGSPRRKERGRRQRVCFRSWDRSSRSSQSCRSSLCRCSRSSESVPLRADGCSIHSDGRPAHSEGHPGQHRRLLHKLAATPWKKHGQLSPEKAMPYSDLGTLYSKLGMLSRFAGTPCEGEDGIREESRDPRALLRVPAPFRKERCRREERPSPRKATLRVHLETPSKGFESPNEERTMPTVKARGPRRHPPSLQRFSREEAAPFTKKGTFGADPKLAMMPLQPARRRSSL